MFGKTIPIEDVLVYRVGSIRDFSRRRRGEEDTPKRVVVSHMGELFGLTHRTFASVLSEGKVESPVNRFGYPVKFC